MNIIIKTCLRCFGHLQHRPTFPMGPSAPTQLPTSVGNDLGQKRKTNIIFPVGPSAQSWQNYWLYMMIAMVIVFTEFWYCQCSTSRETSNLDAGPQNSLYLCLFKCGFRISKESVLASYSRGASLASWGHVPCLKGETLIKETFLLIAGNFTLWILMIIIIIALSCLSRVGT